MNLVSQEGPPRYRLLIKGHSSTGKRSFFNRISTKQQYWQNVYPTYPEFKFRDERFGHQDVHFVVFAPNEGGGFRMVPRDFASCDGVIFLYDITNRISFEAIKRMLEGKKIGEKIPDWCILVGNKADLEEEREVSYEEGRLLAEELDGTEFFEVSAKTRDGIEHVFKSISKRIFEETEKERALKLKNSEKKLDGESRFSSDEMLCWIKFIFEFGLIYIFVALMFIYFDIF